MCRSNPAFVASLTRTPLVSSAAPSSNTAAKCSRRSLLRALPSLAASAALLIQQPREARGAEELSATTDARAKDARAKVSGEASLAQFVKELEGGRVAAVWLFGTFGEYGVFQTSDGKFLHIGEGYPVESAKSPESPLQIAAKVRNYGVPYFIVPIDRSFLRR